MTQPVFAVTYELVTEDSAQDGDAAERGYLGEGLTLRDAIELLDEGPSVVTEANECPVSFPEWFTRYPDPGWYDEEGRRIDGSPVISETRSLHIPEGVSKGTRMRIARLLGCYGIPA